MQDNLKTILIVDDEEDLRDAIAFDFKRQGFNVVQAENGKVAYQIVQNQPVTMVFSDVRMAGGDGVELLKNIKQTHPQIPVVLSTGFAEIGVDEAYDMGAMAVILKPFERKLLKEIVNKILKPFAARVLEHAETIDPIHVEIALEEKNNDLGLLFGSLGASFWWDSGKIKDKMNLKIHFKGQQFQDVVLFGNVKYASGEDPERKKQRIGVEILKAEGSDAERFSQWIQQSNFIPSIPR